MRTHLKKDFGDLANCGESWEISGVNGDLSIVSHGELKGIVLPDLINMYKSQLMGNSVYDSFGDEFPLLLKFIDANDDLSIQVHPNDETAADRHNSFGKTEMWYIIQSDPKSSLYVGFSESVTKQQFKEYSQSSKILNVLNQEEVNKGEVFFLPSGRVHSIGKGILLAEIQQTSDVTYRVYDFDRTDNSGKKRELHIDEAVDVLDYQIRSEYKTPFDPKINDTTKLVECDYFTTNLLVINQSITKSFAPIDSFKVYMCLEGKVELVCGNHTISLDLGESALIPACFEEVMFNPSNEAKLLESYIV